MNALYSAVCDSSPFQREDEKKSSLIVSHDMNACIGIIVAGQIIIHYTSITSFRSLLSLIGLDQRRCPM